MSSRSHYGVMWSTNQILQWIIVNVLIDWRTDGDRFFLFEWIQIFYTLELVKALVGHASEWVGEWVSEWVREMSEWVSERVSAWMSEWVSE